MYKSEESGPMASNAKIGAVRYFLIFALVITTIGFGYEMLPESEASATSFDQTIRLEQEPSDAATQEMLDFSIGALKSASGYSVFANRGIATSGSSEIIGSKAEGTENTKGTRTAAKDLSNALDSIRQLPCRKVQDAELAEKRLGPGVYCLRSAELSGEMVLDGQGSAASTFIFVVEGTFIAKGGSSIKFENAGQSANVFFVAADARIENGAEVRGNVLASGDIEMGHGSVVYEKVLALGKAAIQDAAILGGANGSLRICVEQQLPVSADNNIANRIFHFTVSGAAGAGTAANPLQVAVGTCSKLVQVAAGPQVVTELNSGSLITPPDGTFTGNFELTGVLNQTPGSPSTLGTVNLSTRIANINVVAGGPEGELSLRFTNRRAITGKVEICKRRAAGPGNSNPTGPTPLAGGDADVQGFFQYTVSGVYSVNQQNPNVKTLQIFTIPAGQCSGPISVTHGDPPPFDTGSPTTLATVSELPRVNSFLESIEVIPASRRASADILGTIVAVDGAGAPVSISAPGGGFVNVMLVEGQGPSSETLAVFTNRSNPSRVKVCAIAGPGVPINTLLSFTVTGIGSLNAAHPQTSQYGSVSRTFDVRAGDPAQGGSCELVPGVGAGAAPPSWAPFQTFVNGTPVSIVQNGVSPNNMIEQNPGLLRVSQVRQFGSAFASTEVAGFSPNPDLDPTAERVGRASVIARAPLADVEFSSFRFNPTVLKVCNVSVTPSTVGVVHNFRISFVSPTIGGSNPGQMFPSFSTTVQVAAGPVGSEEGNCLFVNGSALIGGAFNRDSTVVVTQEGSPPASVSNIFCPTCAPGTFTANLSIRRGTISGPGGLSDSINSVVFVTGPTVICRDSNSSDDADPTNLSCRPSRFDFDGDQKADPAVYNPQTGEWKWLASADGYSPRSRTFGVAGDIPVPDDYDGDGVTDYAVFRPSIGRWYIQGSVSQFEYTDWGVAGDIPQAGDFDGDGRSDLVLFRPSNATWYVRTRSNQFNQTQFGIPTDEPVAADYDGDGRADLAVFRNGWWYSLESIAGFNVTQFGQAGDIPLSGDYDGDGHIDWSVFRNGTWYRRTSTAYTVVPFGTADDIPVPADYDADGKTDIAYYRPSEGKWYIRYTATLTTGMPIQLGGPGDIPVPAPVRYFMD